MQMKRIHILENILNNRAPGNFEALILSAILFHREDAYGVPIRQWAEEQSGKMVSVGALYTTLDRMEDKGYISSYMGEPGPNRGGRAKKYFRVEGAGLAALDEWRSANDRIKKGLELNPAGGAA